MFVEQRKVRNMKTKSTDTTTADTGAGEKKITIHQQVEQMLEEFCDEYCKYPEQYSKKYGTDDAGMDKLWNDKCYQCPFMRW